MMVSITGENREIEESAVGMMLDLGVIADRPFFVLGMLVYRFYYETFEKRGSDAGVRGLAFFFGVAFGILGLRASCRADVAGVITTMRIFRTR